MDTTVIITSGDNLPAPNDDNSVSVLSMVALDNEFPDDVHIRYAVVIATDHISFSLR
jgi:hypothetical protein